MAFLQAVRLPIFVFFGFSEANLCSCRCGCGVRYFSEGAGHVSGDSPFEPRFFEQEKRGWWGVKRCLALEEVVDLFFWR